MNQKNKSINQENGVWKKTRDTAAIIHIFFADLLPEIVDLVRNLSDSCDYFLTVPSDQPELIKNVIDQFPNAYILPVENRGRDILPFLDVLSEIIPLGYKYLLKLHTKKTLHRDDGAAWRKDVFAKLAGSPVTVAAARKAFELDPKLGILGPKEHVLDSRFYIGGNKKLIEELNRRLEFENYSALPFPFVASTMFWARVDIFKPLIDAKIMPEEFPEEPLPPDGTLAHALERFFGLLAIEQGYSVRVINSDGTILDANPNAIYQFAPVPKALSFREVKSIVYYPAYKEAYAVEYLRINAPYKAAGIELIPGKINGINDPERVLLGDAVIFQREFPRNHQEYEEIVRIARQNNKLIIYEIDDFLFELPEEHPEREKNSYVDALMPMLSAIVEADVVIVPTKTLGDMLVGFNPNIILLPNYLDTTLWDIKPPQVSELYPITIGYMGSYSHTPDLEILAPVIKQLLEEFEDKLQFKIIGTPLPESLTGIQNIEYQDSPSDEYKKFIPFFQEMDFDIFIAPLAENNFNKCKSPLKFLEYSAMGVPGVYSAIDPYNGMITDGIDGFLASGEDEWKEKITILIQNAELRLQMAIAAQNTVKEKWLLSRNINSWKDICSKLNREYLVSEPTKQLTSHLAQTINQQLYYERINKPDEFRLMQAKDRIGALDREILEYQKVVEGLQGEVREGWDKIAERDDHIEGLQGEVAELRHETGQSRQQFEVLEQEKLVLEQNFQNQEKQLHEIYNSRAWKVLTFYRNQRANISQVGRRPKSEWSRFSRLLPWQIKQSKELLSNSGLFDAEYYLQHNPDVRNVGLDPIEHYLKFGGFEGRNPSADFDSKWYLDHNPDVSSAEINPFLHYLKFGKEEGRAIKPAGYSELIEITQKGAPIGSPTYIAKNIPDEILFCDDLVEIFNKKIDTGFEIALSHDNYLAVTGGVQVTVADEQRKVNREGLGYLHVYPFKAIKILAEEISPLYLCLNLDGQPIGETESGELIMALNLLKDKKLKKVSIHHSMGFNLITMQGLLNCAGKKGVFWIHDYFSICPSYNLKRNDKSYCGAPDINSNACQLCKYVEQRALQTPRFKKLFEDNQLEVISPSQFTYELWQSSFPVKTTGKVLPPARLKWREPSYYRNQSGLLRIGFLGYPLDYKGWKAWMKLVEQTTVLNCYRYYHFSTQAGEPGNYTRIEVQVTQDKRMAMVESLQWNKIDVVVLWSNVAETFSFTLHEALAAGCYILTNPKSGNIQDYIKRHPERGMVLEDDDALIELFESKKIVRLVENYQKSGKPRADLTFGGFVESEE